MNILKLRYIILFNILLLIGMPVFAQRKQAVKRPALTTVENNNIKNGIKLKSNGFKVSEAYLVFDDESNVPEGNKVELNQNVNMLLIIDGGWTETGGRVFPGSRQEIKLSGGAKILNTDEMFAAFDVTGVSPEDARYITLNAIITDLKIRKNYVIVNFRVWDKKGKSEINGSYKLYIM
ncbi:MAG: hypothetical protein ABI760_06470 [Ferruginibacter sp.]